MLALLSPRQAAELLCLSPKTLERIRVSGGGPKFVRIRGSVRYRQEDLESWLASRLVGSTSEEPQDAA